MLIGIDDLPLRAPERRLSELFAEFFLDPFLNISVSDASSVVGNHSHLPWLISLFHHWSGLPETLVDSNVGSFDDWCVA